MFISQDEDLVSPPQKASKVEMVDTVPPPSLKTSKSGWLVQLATFSSQQNADSFIRSLSPSAYSPTVEKVRSYYRVIVRSTSPKQAEQIKSWYLEKDSIKAIVVQSKTTKNNTKNTSEAP